MDPIVFNIRNAKNQAVAYISDNPADNTLTLIVSNPGDTGYSLKAGEPMPEPPPDGGPTSLYLNFGDLVPASEVPQIKVELAGWQVKYFSAPAPAFALTPIQNQTFTNQTTLNVKIYNFPVAGPARTSGINIDYYGFGALDASSSIGSVVVQNAPRSNKTLNLNRSMVSNPVVFVTAAQNSPIKNTLVFHFSNPSPTDPIVDKNTQWGPNPPEFLISFVPGKLPGYGALTTLDRMKDIQVGLAQVYQDGWSVLKDTSGPKPFWRLRPKAHEVLGTGEAATVEFRITDLVTELRPGLSMFYVQYTNIPGYDDGYFAFQIEKRMPTPGILQFVSLTPAVIKRGDPVTLSWQTFDASTLKLTYVIEDHAYERDAPNDVPFNGSYDSSPLPTETLTYSLEVFDYSAVKVQSQVTVTVIQPAPQIKYFVASPTIANLQDGGKVTLYWNVTNIENVKQMTLKSLDSSGNQISDTIDLNLSHKEVTVYRSGGVPFTLHIDSSSDSTYSREMAVTVETWEDMLTTAAAPAGTVMPFAGNFGQLAAMESAGWLKCDGRTVSKGTYWSLFKALGTTYGGDGNPNFALPDLRGYFLRGVDDHSGRDPDRGSRFKQGTYNAIGDTVGSWQGDDLLRHRHAWDHFFFKRGWGGGDIAVHQPPSSPNLQNNSAQATNSDGGGNETRPKNVSVYYLIATGAGFDEFFNL